MHDGHLVVVPQNLTATMTHQDIVNASQRYYFTHSIQWRQPHEQHYFLGRPAISLKFGALGLFTGTVGWCEYGMGGMCFHVDSERPSWGRITTARA